MDLSVSNSNGKAKPNKNGSRMFVQAYALIQ